MKTAQTKSEIAVQVENLSRYMFLNPSENFTVFSGEIINKDGDKIAEFPTHLAAMTALREIRAFL